MSIYVGWGQALRVRLAAAEVRPLLSHESHVRSGFGRFWMSFWSLLNWINKLASRQVLLHWVSSDLNQTAPNMWHSCCNLKAFLCVHRSQLKKHRESFSFMMFCDHAGTEKEFCTQIGRQSLTLNFELAGTLSCSDATSTAWHQRTELSSFKTRNNLEIALWALFPVACCYESAKCSFPMNISTQKHHRVAWPTGSNLENSNVFWKKHVISASEPGYGHFQAPWDPWRGRLDGVNRSLGW